LPVDHYENFPVASWLLPGRLRPPVEAIYAFARGADDWADEGELPDRERLVALDRYSRALDEIEAGIAQSESPFVRLQEAVARHHLPVTLLRDLLDAFRQDVLRKRYATHEEVLDYCRRSANPIGRLLLHLFESVEGVKLAGEPSAVECSDAICTALQLVNFWQDVELDWRKGRLYIPLEDLDRFGVTVSHVEARRADAKWKALMAFECARTRALLAAGAPLARRLPGRIGLEIRATVAGGATILDKIERVGGDVFEHRPVLRGADWIRILAIALMKTGDRPQKPNQHRGLSP
jgi:squalene synthase HpnC